MVVSHTALPAPRRYETTPSGGTAHQSLMVRLSAMLPRVRPKPSRSATAAKVPHSDIVIY